MPVTEGPVRLEIADGVARITLNRPEAGNAVDLALARSLADVAIRCETERAIRCVVLTGAGRLFCAGGDLALFVSAGDRVDALLGELAGTLHLALARLARMAKPLVVLVNGPAAGAGFSLAMSGDVVLCSETAHFTAAYGALGLTPDGGMSWWLPRLVGLRTAQDIILTNRRVKAAEAAAIGLVTRVVAADRLAEEGAAVASAFANAATDAIGAARALLRHSFDSALESQLDREVEAIVAAGAGAEAREGIAALVAKRPPDFR